MKLQASIKTEQWKTLVISIGERQEWEIQIPIDQVLTRKSVEARIYQSIKNVTYFSASNGYPEEFVFYYSGSDNRLYKAFSICPTMEVFESVKKVYDKAMWDMDSKENRTFVNKNLTAVLSTLEIII